MIGITGWIPDIADEPALGSQLDRFWEAGPGFPGLRAEPRVPEVPDALLRELEPGTLAILGDDLPDLLRPAYRAITEASARRAAGELVPDEDPAPDTERGTTVKRTRAAAKPTRATAPGPAAVPVGPSKPVGRAKPAKAAPTSSGRLTSSDLDELIEEATIDCYGEAEQAVGLLATLEEHVRLPFRITIFGGRVSIVSFDLTERNEIVAVCRHSSQRVRMLLTELPPPSPEPEGFEWVLAYLRWAQQWLD